LRNKLLGAIDVFNYENPQIDKPNIEENDQTISKSYADLMPTKPDIPVIEITSEYADPIVVSNTSDKIIPVEYIMAEEPISMTPQEGWLG